MSTRVALLIVMLVVLITACKKNPQFIGVDKVRVAGLKDSTLFVNLLYKVYNPNGVKSTLKAATINVYFKEELVGTGRLIEAMALQSNDTIKIPVECAISLEKLHHNYQALVQSTATVFRLKGTNQVKFLMRTMEMDVDEEISLNTRDIVKQEVKRNFSDANNFNVKSIGLQQIPTLGKSNFSMHIELRNQLPMDYTIESMQLNFYRSSKEQLVATWSLTSPIQQLKHEKTTMPIEAEVNNINLLKQGSLTWLLTQKARFKMFGDAVVRVGEYRFTVPIDDEVEIGM